MLGSIKKLSLFEKVDNEIKKVAELDSEFIIKINYGDGFVAALTSKS